MHRAGRAIVGGRFWAMSASPLRRAFSCRLLVQSIMDQMNFGITLSNRAVPLGLCSVRDLLALADAVEACPALDSVWCGDALFVNRRLDALTLLAAVAGRTERVLLGPACMGSFSRCATRSSSPMNGPPSTCSRTAGHGLSSVPAAADRRPGRRRARRSAFRR